MASWTRVLGQLQIVAAHSALLCFTSLLVVKIGGQFHRSWWWVFLPLYIFHAIVIRGRFSLPAPLVPHDRHWAPCHSVIAIPLLVVFEVLLCCFLVSFEAYGTAAVSLKVVFFPLILLEIIILFDNFRMCKTLMPGDEESMTDEAIWETLPYFWVAVSMVFFIAATLFTMLKLSGDVGALGWWDLCVNFGIAECFSFLVCTKWSNPSIQSDQGPAGPIVPSFSMLLRQRDGESQGRRSLMDDDDAANETICGQQDLGGHLIKIPIIAFQVLLCMHLEGTPARARHFPPALIFSPIFFVQGVAVLLSLVRLVEHVYLVLPVADGSRSRSSLIAQALECCGFLHNGSRLLGWWSMDASSREDHARLLSAADPSNYNTFTGLAPEVVKKMPRKDLAEEVWRLQAALGEQAEITKQQQQEFDRLRNEKLLCRICFEREIAVVLLPCRHRILCSCCSEKCKFCPVCRSPINERMSVYDV